MNSTTKYHMANVESYINQMERTGFNYSDDIRHELEAIDKEYEKEEDENN